MKTKITLLLLTFFSLVSNVYSQTDEDPDNLGGPVIIGNVAPFTLPNSNSNARMLKSSNLTAKTFSTLSATSSTLEWPNPGAVNIEKTAEATTTPGKWKVNLMVEGKNIPKTTDVVLVIDDSGSMSGTKITSAKDAAKTFVNELLTNSSGIRIAVVTINAPNNTGSPQLDQGYTNNISTLNTAINAIGANGGTNIQGGFRAAGQLVGTSTADKKVVILLSDGEPTYSYETTGLITPTAPNCIGNGNNRYWNTTRSAFESGMSVTSSNYGNIVGSGNNFDYTLYRKTSNNCDDFIAGNHGMPTKYEAGLLINAGVDVYTIGFEVGNDVNAQNTLNGSQNKGYFPATSSNISNIYSQIRSNIAYAATNAVLTDPMSTYIVLDANSTPTFSVLPSTTGNVVLTKGTVTFSNNGYVLNDPDNPASGNSSLIKWKITWNIGTVSEVGDNMYYYVTMAPNTDPTILYDANEKTYMNYTDVNGNPALQETPTDFTIPKVSGGKGSIEIIYYAVNEAGQPINSSGVVVPKENAVKLIPGNSKYFQFNGSTALEVNQVYTVIPDPLYTSSSIAYQLYCSSGNVSITPTPTEPNKVVWFGYRVSTPPTTTLLQPTCTVATGTITVTAPTGTGMTYSIDGSNYVSNATFSNIAPGTYSVTAKSATGCISTATSVTINAQPATPAAPTSNGDITECQTSPLQTLNANNALNSTTGITWYDALTAGNVVTNPTLNSVGNVTYYAQYTNGTCSSLTRTAVKLTIYPKAGIPTANNVEYCAGDTAQALTATASDPTYSLYFYDSLISAPQSSIIPTTTNAGEFTYYVAEGINNTCIGAKKAITVTVYPKSIITTQPVNQNITYGDNTSFSVTATNVTSYQWQVNTGTGFTNITNGGIYSNATTATLTLTKPTVVMSSYTYRAILTGRCTNTETTTVNLTVIPKAVTVTADNKTKVYGEANPALTAVVTGAVNGDVIDYTLATTATDFSPVGTYPIAVTLGTNPNYIVTKVDGTLTVTPKELNVVVTADNKTKVYGEANPALTAVVTGAVNGDVIDYTLATTATDFSPVGTYPIAVTLGTNPNYIVTKVDGTLTVTPKELNVVVTADNKTKVYGEANPALTAVVTGAVNGDVIDYTLATTATDFSPVGTYPIAVTLGTNPNYIVTKVDGTLTVTPKELNVVVTADNKTKVYGEANPALTAVVTGAVNGDVIDYTLATTAMDFSPVGTYPIAVTLGTNPNYIVTKVDGTLTVTPKELNVVVTADNKTKVYGEANPALTAVVTGAVNGDVIDYTLATTATDFSPVGTYPIAVTLGTNPNYIVTKVDGTLTVTPKELNVVVTADNKTKVYGEANPALTAVVTGAVNGDVIDYTLATTATDFSPVGTYPIAVTLGTNPNYIVTKVDGTLTVTPKELNVVVTADNKTKVYGEANPALTAVVTGAVNGDVIDYTLATTATDFSPVGTYPIAVTLGTNPNYIVTKVDGTLTVTPKELNVVVTADNKTKVYGEANPALTAVVTGAVNGDVIDYTLATTATDFSPVGTYPIAVTLGTNPNYIVTKVDGTLTVTPKELNVVVTADNKTKVYGEANPALTAVVTGAVNGDVIDYTLATTATDFSPVGTYPIAVTLGTNPNYIVTKVDGTLTVTPKELNVVVTADNKTKVYGEANPALTAVVTGAVNGDVIDYTLATTATDFSPVGTYPIAVTLGTNPNYIVTKVDGTLTVTPKELNVVVTADNKTKVYGEANPALTAVVTGAVNGDVIDYTLATTATDFSPVGTYPIAVTLGTNPNYIVTKVDGTLTVTPKELNVVVTADNKTKVYGEANPALTAVVTGAVNGDVIDYTLATTATDFSPVGTYPIAVTLGTNPNYIVTKVDGTLTVTPKELNVVVTADNKTKVYGEANPALTAVVTGAVNGDVIDYTLATTAMDFSPVGTYPIAVTLGTNPNYIVTKVDGTLTVTPKELNVVVTADNKTKVYGEANPALTAVVTGAVNGDVIDYTLATTATDFSPVGTYPIAVTLGTNPNYIVTKVDGTLTVTPKELNVVVTADNKTKVYGEANPALTAVVTGAVNGDVIDYTLATTATDFSPVGTYPIAVTLGTNPNYIVTKVDGTLTVTPKELNVVVTADNKTKVYGEANPALTAVVTGAVNGDVIDYTLATTATDFSPVGTYPIAVTLGTNPNYIVTKVDGTLTVTPKELNVVVTADNKTKVYGEANPALTAVVTGAVNGDVIDYTLATTATDFSPVGTYPIAVTLGTNPNYIVTKVDGTLTVTPKELNVVVTADNKTKVYGEANPALTAVVTGAVNGDVIDYTLATTATDFSPVGTYPIAVTLGTNPNYIVTKVDGTLTVTPKELNVVVTADNKTKVYGEANPALTAVVTGAVNGDVIDYTLATTATDFSPVGTYPIAVTLGTNPNYIVTKVDGTLTVTPKELNVVVTADNKTKVYGEANPALTAVVTGAVNGDVIDYTLATTATDFSPVGTYPIAVTLGTNPNYIVTKVDGTLTVTPKELNVVVTADNKTKVYGEANPALTAVVTGAVNGDVIDYTLATTATDFSPVGTYPIVVTLGTNPNYIVTKVDGTLTVTPKELNVVVTADNKTKVYGEANPALTAVVTGAVNGDVIDYTLATTATDFSPVGTYPIAVTLGTNPNYIVTKVDGTLTVTPKELNVVVTADNKTKVYGEANPALTAVVTGAVNGDVIDYTLATTATDFSPVGTYPIAVTLGTNPNYIVTKVDGTLTVTPKELNVVVTADNKTKVYGEANPALTAVVTGAVNGDVIDYTLATTATDFSPVGTYPIAVTLGTNPNYIVTKVDGTLTVTPKELNVVVTADNKTKVYGEANPALTAVVTGAVNGDVIDYTLATTATDFSPVGTYPIAVTLGTNPNYIVTKVDGTLTVTPKELNVVVTADNKTKVYGEANPALTAVVTGAVNGDVIDYTLATTATDFSPVGTYPIVVTLGTNPNYIVTKVDGTLTVTPKELNVVVTADNKTKVYGEANPALTAVVTGAVNGDVIDYTLATTATDFSPVGTYPIAVTLGTNPNYIVTKVDGTLTVTPKELNVVVTADNKTKVYGEANPALTAVVTGAVNGDVIDYTLATTATDFSPVGTYPIVVTLGTNPNYIVTKVDGTLTVTPKELNVVVTADNKTKVYGEANPALTAVVTGAVNGDVIDYTLATTATDFSPVGTYPIAVTLGTNPNYIVTKVDGTLTITSSAIDANDDIVGPINGINGGNAGINILNNDYLNGSIVNPAEITISFVNSNNPGITLVGTDINIAPGIPAGNYELVYKICENININSNCDNATVKISVYTPSISINKDGSYVDSNNDGKTNVGDQIKYTFAVKNTGGSKLTNITITDNKVTVLGGPIDLNVDESDTTTFSAFYTITQEDINKGVVYNLATAKGTPPVGDPVTATSTDPTPCTTCPKDPECTDCTITEVPQNPGITITKEGAYVDTNNDGKTNIGDVVSYKFVITNTGNVTLTNITVTDNNATVTGGPIATLAPGATDATTFTASHAITQDDINKGIVYNLATATAKDPKDNPVTATSTDPTPCTTCPKDPTCTDCTITEVPQNPAIAITKEGAYVDTNNDGKTNIGDVVSYKFVITNTGNVTLTNITVTDNNATVTGGPIATLAPGATDATTFTASHAITQDDINKGIVYNLATATAKDPKDNPVTATSTDPTPCTTCPKDPTCTDCTITEVPQNPAIAITKEGAYVDTNNDGKTNIGDVVSYKFVITNTGNVTLTNITVTDNNATVTGGPIATLAPGATDATTFTASHAITQDDINKGIVYNLATATAKDPKDNPVTATSTDPTPCTTCPKDPECTDCTITEVPQNPAIAITKEGAYVDTNNDGKTNIGDVVSYKFVITNTGNVTLTNITVTDNNATVTGGPIATLAPGATDATTFTASHAITQDDINKGIVYNLATATAKDPKDNPVTATSTDPTPCTTCPKDPTCTDCTITEVPQNPGITITKEGAYVDTNNDGKTNIGDVVSYKFVITNTGNVTLTNITVTDNNATVTGGPIATLAPGATDATKFTASHAITQDDINKGIVYNLATATAKDPKDNPVTATSTDPTPCTTCPKDPTCTDCTITEVPQNPGITITKEGAYVDTNNDGKTNIGDVVSYKFVITNTGNVTLTNITVTDNNATVTGGPIATLAPGATDATTFTASHAITQDDINKGIVYNLATATAKDPKDNPVTATSTDPTPCTTCPKDPECTDCTITEVPQNPAIAITKEGAYVDTNNDGKTNIGDVVSYKFVITNTGNVTLTNITVTDNNATVTGGPIATLAPGATDATTFTASHAITQDDINKGIVYNLATATAKDPKDNPVTATSTDPTPCTTCPKDPTCTDCTITEVPQNPGITITKEGAYVDTNNDGKTNIGDVVSYKFVITNTGNVTLTNITVTDNNATVTGGPIATLAPGATDATTFTASHAITQDDINKGIVYNLATATAKDPKDNPVTATSTDPTPCTTCPKDPTCTDCTITEVPQNPAIAITKEGAYVDTNNDGKTNIGDVVSYKFVITNTGNVTLTNITVTDNNATVTGGPIATLAPGATDATTFTASHAITQDDINKGIVYNLATATAKDPKDNPVTATSTDPTPCTTCPKDPTCTDCTITEVPQNAGLTVNKTATVISNNTQTDVYSFVGDVINYTINVINTGNVTIHNIIVKDPLTGLDTTNQSFSLLPGENKEFTQSLTVTLADLNNESITNIATASGLTPNNNPIEAEDSVIVERAGVLGCGTIDVHNAFTPNGDGTNDNFVIDNITDTTCYPENTVEIYNRWGILVYETKGYDNVNNAFKGYSEGRVTVDKTAGLPAGTYFYILNYTAVGLQGEVIPNRKQGYLYLTR